MFYCIKVQKTIPAFSTHQSFRVKLLPKIVSSMLVILVFFSLEKYCAEALPKIIEKVCVLFLWFDIAHFHKNKNYE